MPFDRGRSEFAAQLVDISGDVYGLHLMQIGQATRFTPAQKRTAARP